MLARPCNPHRAGYMNTTAPSAPARRHTGLLERLIAPLDQTLRTLFAEHTAARPNPAGDAPETLELPEQRRHIAGLMRVNHAGEVSAQALYQGQAAVSRSPATRAALLEAAAEETDHLAWCADRIRELGGRTSLFNPLWYAGSFTIGALAGLAGDRISLGFVAETEKQVGQHLQGHLDQLPVDDARTRAIIEQMSEDEARHGHNALQAGGVQLPPPVRTLMQLTSRVMTFSAYRL